MENILEQKKELLAKEFDKILLTNNLSDKLLGLACENCGFDKQYHRLIFPGGLNEIFSYISLLHDDKLSQELCSFEIPKSITKKVALATQHRVKLINKSNLKKIIQFYFNPIHSFKIIKPAFRSCDIIWRYAGDQSLDYNYYSKRTLLLTVYLPALLYYSNDNSTNQYKTNNFIESCLEKIVKLGRVKSRIRIPKIEDIPILRMFI